jgi:hypothetical protein
MREGKSGERRRKRLFLIFVRPNATDLHETDALRPFRLAESPGKNGEAAGGPFNRGESFRFGENAASPPVDILCGRWL